MDKNQAQLDMEWLSEDGWYAFQRLIRMRYYLANTFEVFPNEIAVESYISLNSAIGRVPYSLWDEVMAQVEEAMRTDFQKGCTRLNIDTLTLAPYDDDVRELMVGAVN